jgi:hypothetical protein
MKRNDGIVENKLVSVFRQFRELHEKLDVLGGRGVEGYQLLPAACGALYEARITNARLSLRESILASSKEKINDLWRQTKKEEDLRARIGIDLAKDLRSNHRKALALAVVYECNKDPSNKWEIASESDLGHWIVLVGDGYIPKECDLGGYDGIVLDSNRGYERWKLDTQSGLQLNRPKDGSGASEVRSWVYSLITIQIGEN